MVTLEEITAFKYEYLITLLDDRGQPDLSYGMKGEAENIFGAREAAWQLYLWTEQDIGILQRTEEIGPSQFDFRGVSYALVATLKFEWVEEE